MVHRWFTTGGGALVHCGGGDAPSLEHLPHSSMHFAPPAGACPHYCPLIGHWAQFVESSNKPPTEVGNHFLLQNCSLEFYFLSYFKVLPFWCTLEECWCTLEKCWCTLKTILVHLGNYFGAPWKHFWCTWEIFEGHPTYKSPLNQSVIPSQESCLATFKSPHSIITNKKIQLGIL